MSDLDTQDDTYVSRPGEKQDDIPVHADHADVETSVGAKTAHSEEQLGTYRIFLLCSALLSILNGDLKRIERDSGLITVTARDGTEAIDESNVINERTRSAKSREPGDEEGLEDEKLE